jgi:copper chaperone CopZ
METIRLKIAGMTCGHCVAAVNQALNAVPGVSKVQVGLGQAQVSGEADAALLLQAVAKAGYQAQLAPA